MKTKLEYTVRTTRAPGEQSDSWVPMIVDRVQPTGLDDILEKCIDRGLVAGIKPTAVKTIAEGVAQQIAKELSEGRGIQFGQYFYGRPYLSGTADSNGRLSGDNAINVRLYKGNAFRLGASDFTLTFADGGNNPTIDFIVSEGDTPRGEVVKGRNVKVNGRMLYGAGDTVRVRFADVAAEAGAAEVAEFTAVSAELLGFACPAALVPGRKYAVTVERTDANGVTRISGPKTVACTGPAVPAPKITRANSGDSDGTIAVNGGVASVYGANLEEVTDVELWKGEVGAGTLVATVPAAWGVDNSCLNTDPIDEEGLAEQGGYLRVATDGGADTYPLSYYA